MILKKTYSETAHTQIHNFERRLCTQTQKLNIVETFYMSQTKPKEFVHNTGYSVQLHYVAGLSL